MPTNSPTPGWRRFVLAALAAPAVLAAPAGAQLPEVPARLVDGIGPGFDWTPGLGAGHFRSTAIGHFRSLTRLDVAVVRGNYVYLATAPGVYASLVGYDLTGKDIATLPSAAGEYDRLAIVGNGGLELAQYDPLIPCPMGTELCFLPVVTAAGTGAWVNVSHVVSHPIDQAHGHDLAAIAQDGTLVVLALDDGAGGFTYEQFAPGDRAHAIAVGQWTPGGDAEVVVATDSGVMVYSRAGVLLHTELNVSNDDQLVLLPDQKIDASGAPVSDGFAWLTWHPNGTTRLLTVLGEGFRENPVDVTAKGLARLTGGPIATGQRRNLYGSSNNSFQVHVLDNAGGNDGASPQHQSFANAAGLTGVEYHPGPGSPSSIQVEPAVADFDVDGLLDVVLPVKPLEHIAYFGPYLAPESALGDDYGVVASQTCHSFYFDSVTNTADGIGVLELVIDVPEQLLGGEVVTHVEVVVWEAPDTDLGTVSTGIGLSHCLFEIPNASASITGCLEAADSSRCPDTTAGTPPPDQQRLVLPVFIDPTGWTDSDDMLDIEEALIVEWRPVRFDGGSVVAGGRTQFVRWTPNDDAEATADWIDDRYWPVGTTIFVANVDHGGTQTAGTAHGGVVPTTRTPHPSAERPGQTCKDTPTGSTPVTTTASASTCTSGGNNPND